MTQMKYVATVIFSGISLSFFWFVFAFLLRDLRVDRFRQEVFALRDELFDFAAGGGIGFSDAAYVGLRTFQNSLIRFAHQLTFARALSVAIAAVLWPSPLSGRSLRRLLEPLRLLPEGETKDRLTDLERQTMVVVTKYLVLGSPLLMFSLVLYGAYKVLSGAILHLPTLMLGFSRRIPGIEQLEAEAIDCDESEASELLPA